MLADNELTVDSISASKVLVVDDKKENHRAIASILNNLNAEIYNAMTGYEAISLSLRHRFSVILLDVMMPEMDGFETASVMRINEETQITPIIFITAASRDDMFEFHGYEVGAVDYLFKPIKPMILENKVRVFVELERKRSQLQNALVNLNKLKRRNQLILNSVGEGIVGFEKNGTVIFSNPAARELLNYKEEKMSEASFDSIFITNDINGEESSWHNGDLYRECKNRNRYHCASSCIVNSSKERVPVEYTATPIMDGEKFVGVVVAFIDISERIKSEKCLENMAKLDALTGLDNRSSFTLLLDQAISRSQRSGQPLALLFLDLDKFKQVNDNLGHEVGDILLQQVAHRLQLCVRDADVICRFGGDEFTIILEPIDSERSASVVARKIIRSLSDVFDINGVKIYVGVSIGISTYPGSGNTGEALLRCADIAMYKVKANCRNDFCFFTDSMEKDVREDLILENSLRNAIKREQFELNFQPKIDPYQNKLVGVEALIRWKLDNGKMVPPSVFIQKAEETGLIVDIGNWVIEESCRITKQWYLKGLLGENCSVSINLSVRQLQERNLVNCIEKAIVDSNIPAKYFEFEITESVVMNDIETSVNILNRLHALGVKLSIDDFGTGYSSLSYLRQLPIDALKIDRSFVLDIGKSNQDQAIIKAIIMLAHNLDLTVIAEGVENESQLEYLKRQKCDAIQGYHFSMPLSYSRATEYMGRFC